MKLFMLGGQAITLFGEESFEIGGDKCRVELILT
jgi:hypothetical protein